MRALVLASHTDDGEIGCGGAISRWIEEGHDLHYVAFSTAQTSVRPGLPTSILEVEIREATAILGIPEVNLRILSSPVRRFSEHRQEVLDELIGLRERLNPDVILIPSPDDIHQDHQVVAQEGLRALKRHTLLGYEEPWNNIAFQTRCFVALEERHVERKIKALACYRSQSHRAYLDAEFLRSLARTRGTQVEGGYAEAFEVLRWMVPRGASLEISGRVLLTACGCPGASTLIRMLKGIVERRIEVIGADVDDQAVGRFLADSVHVVPPADDPTFVQSLLDLVDAVEPDVVFSQSSAEVPVLARHLERFEERGVAVPISRPEAIDIASNKHTMYETLRVKTDLPLPAYRLVPSLDSFRDAISELRYPDCPICFKPPIAKGSRGFRVLDAHADRKDLLLNQEPNSRYITIEECEAIFREDLAFPDLLVMEMLEGPGYTTDPIVLNGEMLLCTVKTMEAARWGVIVRGELVDRPELVEQTSEILKAIPLSYNVNLQFIGERLIEINPQVSTFIYQDDLNAPYLAIRLALGEIGPDDVRAYQDRVAIGRRMVRYMDQVFWTTWP